MLLIMDVSTIWGEAQVSVLVNLHCFAVVFIVSRTRRGPKTAAEPSLTETAAAVRWLPPLVRGEMGTPIRHRGMGTLASDSAIPTSTGVNL